MLFVCINVYLIKWFHYSWKAWSPCIKAECKRFWSQIGIWKSKIHSFCFHALSQLFFNLLQFFKIIPFFN